MFKIQYEKTFYNKPEEIFKVIKTTSNKIDVDNLQSGIFIVKIVDEQKEIVN
jgi:hypothetical protein